MASFLITANDTMFCNISRFLKQRPRHSGHFWSGEKLVALACAFCVSADTIIESYTGPVQDKRTLWIGLLFAILLLVCVACPFDGNIMVGIAWCVIFPLPVDLPMSVSVVIAEPLIVLSYQRTWCGITLAIVVTASRTAQLAWQQGLPDRLNIKDGVGVALDCDAIASVRWNRTVAELAPSGRPERIGSSQQGKIVGIGGTVA